MAMIKMVCMTVMLRMKSAVQQSLSHNWSPSAKRGDKIEPILSNI